jgi:competence protein ComEC
MASSRSFSDRPKPGAESNAFVTVDADLDRDWMVRPSFHILRVPRFRMDGREIDEPLTIVARFRPAPIGLQQLVIAEGLLRRTERDELTLVVKSPLLMRYAGAASRLSPATWNRALANRLRPYTARFPIEVGLVEALALGRGERLHEEVRDGYKRAGTYHLLVFSGLQIAFAAAALAAMLRWLHAPRASDWSLLGFSAIAPMFIGSNASVSRASIALGLYAISRLMHRPTTYENLWCVAALVRLAVAPGDLGEAAFQLTYGGAGALLFVAKPFSDGRARWLVYAASVECVVTAMTLFHFHQYALGGSVMTLALTPVIFAMLAISAAACLTPCATLFHCIGALHRIATALNGFGSAGSGAFAAPPVQAYCAGLMLAIVAIVMLTGRRRALAIAGLVAIPLATAVVVSLRDVDRPTMTVLDVGQGDAIVLRTRGHAMLIDGGPSPSRIVPLLADRGIRRLDIVLLTHAHPDHCGGIPAVLQRLSVRELWVSPRRFSGDCATSILEAARDVPIHLVRDGDRAMLGEMFIRAFAPDRTFRRAPENNSSVVVRAALGRRVVLLTGDIERDAENQLASRIGCVDILKVAHHGSRTSSTPLLLDSLAPRLAFISCGRHNLFGHPHLEVLEALLERDIRAWRRDRNGSIVVECDRGHVYVRPQIDTP